MTVKGLNPYSNGMLTQFNLIKKYIWKQDWCLNPYSNGMLTQTNICLHTQAAGNVLILILMECLLSILRLAI